MGISSNFGYKVHFLELGLGGTNLDDTVNSDDHLLFYLYIGYRLKFRKPYRPSLKVSANFPVIGINSKELIESIVGISLGLRYKPTA